MIDYTKIFGKYYPLIIGGGFVLIGVVLYLVFYEPGRIPLCDSENSTPASGSGKREKVNQPRPPNFG